MFELKKKYIRKTRTRDPYRDPTGKPGPHWKTRTPSENQDPIEKQDTIGKVGPRRKTRTPPEKRDPTRKAGPYR